MLVPHPLVGPRISVVPSTARADAAMAMERSYAAQGRWVGKMLELTFPVEKKQGQPLPPRP
jgi:hypothetical protein